MSEGTRCQHLLRCARNLTGFATIDDKRGDSMRERKIDGLKLCPHSADGHFTLVGTDILPNFRDTPSFSDALPLRVRQSIG